MLSRAGVGVAGLARVLDFELRILLIAQSQRKRGHMSKNLLIFLTIVALGSAMWGIFTDKSSEKPQTGNNNLPPLTGSMHKFTLQKSLKPASKLYLLNQDNTRVFLSDYQGKVVLINFWATWCAPCIREMPSLSRLQKARSNADFNIIALSQDQEGWAAILPFIRKNGFTNLTIWLDQKAKVARDFGIEGIPTSILLGRSGQIIGTLKGTAEWDAPEALALIDFYLKKRK